MDMNMNKLASIDEFITMQTRLVANDDREMPTVVISAGTCGQASGANALIRMAKRSFCRKSLQIKFVFVLQVAMGSVQWSHLCLWNTGGHFIQKSVRTI